jgi:hypothetical protein
MDLAKQSGIDLTVPTRTLVIENPSTYFRQLVVGKIGESVQTQRDEHGSSGGREAPSG